jgi:hypothetical protein
MHPETVVSHHFDSKLISCTLSSPKRSPRGTSRLVLCAWILKSASGGSAGRSGSSSNSMTSCVNCHRRSLRSSSNLRHLATGGQGKKLRSKIFTDGPPGTYYTAQENGLLRPEGARPAI